MSKPPNMVFIMADDLGYADVDRCGRPSPAPPGATSPSCSVCSSTPHLGCEARGDRVEIDRLGGSKLRRYDGGTRQTCYRMVRMI